MFLNPSSFHFPHPSQANVEGLLAIGGDLDPKRLLTAYQKGIFPWYNEGEPILWWSPDPRMVLFPEKLKISKSMKQLFKKQAFEVSVDQNFEAVIDNCANVPRNGQVGTWITNEMKKAYIKLHGLGYAKSVEVWKDGALVGGLYGIYVEEQNIFCGESMFTKVSNASKYAFIWWVQQLREKGIKLIDCQMYTDHLASLGAEEISREAFLSYLKV
ncbi:leucyl/phenylalanyl-tRNA--protein transferase [Psychroflexus planctonicus]|uniref:Leucyl/phenylalanyl-tRNA--protein transferase n=1 Tax=Psychroflexus planctonicus TaxID=1526575 RepID=A0ABQ1SJJ5_9FLAO|nr:leucyl/phenylalanyl-tRNA--protein transferase [Psychroflexus planctonicus]GGE39994.1 leucyl/phenylalanyl-tRNA--protein transferase [Psychroflexus planctonicus]